VKDGVFVPFMVSLQGKEQHEFEHTVRGFWKRFNLYFSIFCISRFPIKIINKRYKPPMCKLRDHPRRTPNISVNQNNVPFVIY
jgi:hypothetical protein